MNIDERLERLAERHEALAQSVDLMQISGREQGARIDELGRHIDKVVTISERLLRTSEQDAENIRTLARIAELHEHRLTDLEGRQ